MDKPADSVPDEPTHDCPGCDKAFPSAQSLYAHWSTHPDHRGLSRDSAESAITQYLDSVGPTKRRDAIGVALGVFIGSLIVHAPGLYFDVLQWLAGMGMRPDPSAIVPAAAFLRLLQKGAGERELPITEQQVDEIIFGAAIAWLAIVIGHQVGALV